MVYSPDILGEPGNLTTTSPRLLEDVDGENREPNEREKEERTLDELESEDRIAFRYVDNPNGSLRNIAGVLNRERNVMGMMPHPERASEPLMGSSDGLVVFQSMLQVAAAV